MTKRMKKWLMRVLIPTSLIAVLLLSMTAIASAAVGTQDWYLDNEGHSDVSGANVMWKGDTSAVSGSTPIAAGDYQLWAADEAAAVDVTFPLGDEDVAWLVELRVDKAWATTSSKCVIDVGYCDTAGAFTSFGLSEEAKVRIGLDILYVEVQLDAVTVPAGDYLALQVWNNSGVDHEVVSSSTGCQGCSWVKSPCSDPGYPVPEMATALLFGAGIVGLVGYAYVRHQRREALP